MFLQTVDRPWQRLSEQLVGESLNVTEYQLFFYAFLFLKSLFLFLVFGKLVQTEIS